MEKGGKGLGLASETEETLGSEDVEVLDSRVCDVSETETDSDTVSDEKEVEGDVASVDESGTVEPTEETVSSDDDIIEPETEINDADDGIVDETEFVEAERDEVEEESVISGGNELTDDKEDAGQNAEADMVQQSSVDANALSVTEHLETQSTNKTEEDNYKLDVDSKHANVGLDEQGSEVKDANHLESVQLPQDSIQSSKGEANKENPGIVSQVSSPGELRYQEEITNVDQKEENGEVMDIDCVAEEQVEKDVTVGGVLDNAGASMIENSDVPIADADREDSNVLNEMEIDERKDNAGMATESTVSANPNSPREDAATGEVEPMDHNALFDPSSDITNFIDFSGVSSWSGNIQDLKTETGNISLKDDMKPTDMAKEVTGVDCEETHKSVDATTNGESAEGIDNESNEAHAAATYCSEEAPDVIMGSEENQEGKDHECLDKKTVDQQDVMSEEDDITQEAPSIDPNQKEDTDMEENPYNSDDADDGADSNIKPNGVKRKADVLSEDSPGEGRKTVSFAKVSFTQRQSFKIGACIARAASQMAGSPSVLKGGNVGDETLSVESFVSQLQCAATDPDKGNVVSEIAVGFFLDFRNSSASQQVTPEKVSNKRGRPSNSNAGGTEAFEFEEMGDTYWTDRVVDNGGEEQTQPTGKENCKVVPVELEPVQLQRTRRPYRRRQTQIISPLPASNKPADYDENAPAELIMNFSETDTIPPEKSLSKMFRHFGPIRESQTEVDKEKNRARVVYRKGTDAEVAYSSAGRFSIFGTKAVNYELSYTVTEAFTVHPYVVSLGEEDAAPWLPS